MPTPIATDIEGAHPYFLGVDEPQDFAASARWKVLAENNPRKAILQAKFAEGQVLTMRVGCTAAPATKGNRASFPLSSVQTAEWLSHKEHVKLLVTHTAAPASRTLSVDYTASGVTLLADGEGGIDILAGATKIGALPRPWFEYNVGGDAEKRTRVFLDWSTTVGSLSITMPELTAAEWQGAVLDPTVITTSTASTATAYSNQRKLDVCQNGVKWKVHWGGGATLVFDYSTDGTTWTSGGTVSFAGTGTTYTPSASFFIDPDDYAHLAYKDRHDGYIYYRRGTPNAARTAWTWGTATAIWSSSTNADHPDLIAHREGTGWTVHAVFSRPENLASAVVHYRITVASDGTLTLNGAQSLASAYGNTIHKWPSIDFNHTGDGKTVAGGTPHLYAAWSAGATGAGKGIRFKKATYSAGSWTWGTEREINSSFFVENTTYWLNCLFDGTRTILVGQIRNPTSGDIHYYIADRDVADTTTTVRLNSNISSFANSVSRGSASYDDLGNVYLIGANEDEASGSRDLVYRRWNRSSALLEAEVLIDSNVAEPYVSAKRGYSGNKIEFIYTDGAASPYSVTYSSISLAQRVAVNPVIETDSARPLTRVKKRAIVRATETDTAVVVGRRKLRSVGVAGEWDVANTISKGVRIPMDWATETDTAVSVGVKFTPVYYTFTPPTVNEAAGGDRLFSRYTIPVGQTVIKVDGEYVVSPYPWIGDLEGLTDGVDYFLGGHVYTVDNTVANELMEAGYTLDRVS